MFTDKLHMKGLPIKKILPGASFVSLIVLIVVFLSNTNFVALEVREIEVLVKGISPSCPLLL
jgi:hypothetical protein